MQQVKNKKNIVFFFFGDWAWSACDQPCSSCASLWKCFKLCLAACFDPVSVSVIKTIRFNCGLRIDPHIKILIPYFTTSDFLILVK